MALFTTSPTQKALTPMEQLLKYKKPKAKTPMTLLTPEEQQTQLWVTTPKPTLTTPEVIPEKTPMEQLVQPETVQPAVATVPGTITPPLPTDIPPTDVPPVTETPSENVNAPRTTKNPNGKTNAQVASDKAWEHVSGNKDWFGDNARRPFETDQQWHDRLVAEAREGFVPAMETKYDDAGRPVEVGYYDWDGNWVQTTDLGALNTALGALTEAANAVPNLIDIQNSEQFRRLTDMMNNPNATQADIDAAERSAAEQMGLSVEQLRTIIAQGRTQAGYGVNAQQGMTQQEISEYDRKTALERQDIMRQGQELMNQFMGKSGGSAIAAGNARNAIIGTLATFQAQKDAQQTELDWIKKNAEYNALVARNQQLFDMKSITAGQYLEQIKNNRTIAIQATMAQLNALAQQNQLEIEKYSAIAGIRYQEVMAQLGVLQGVSQKELDDYEKYMAPILEKARREAEQAAKDQKSSQDILGIIGTIISTIALFA